MPILKINYQQLLIISNFKGFINSESVSSVNYRWTYIIILLENISIRVEFLVIVRMRVVSNRSRQIFILTNSFFSMKNSLINKTHIHMTRVNVLLMTNDIMINTTSIHNTFVIISVFFPSIRALWMNTILRLSYFLIVLSLIRNFILGGPKANNICLESHSLTLRFASIHEKLWFQVSLFIYFISCSFGCTNCPFTLYALIILISLGIQAFDLIWILVKVNIRNYIFLYELSEATMRIHTCISLSEPCQLFW